MPKDELTPVPVCAACGARMSRLSQRVRVRARQREALVLRHGWLSIGREYLASPLGYALPTLWHCGSCQASQKGGTR